MIPAVIEITDEIATEHAVDLADAEGNENVEEEGGDGVAIVGGGGQSDGGVTGTFGPFGPGEIGEHEQRFPNVGRAVAERLRDRGTSAGNAVLVVGDELGAAFLEGGDMVVDIAETSALFICRFA